MIDYKLRIANITTLRPYIFIVSGGIVGCMVASLFINFASESIGKTVCMQFLALSAFGASCYHQQKNIGRPTIANLPNVLDALSFISL